MSESMDELMRANLLGVFGERNDERRREVINRIYTPTVEFIDPDEIVIGHAALNAKAQKILDGAPGFVFSASGPVYVNHDMGFLAWHFGPVGQTPVVSGMDICFLENDRIAKIYTVLTT